MENKVTALTTVIPTETHKQIKRHCILRNTKIKSWLNDAIEQKLERDESMVAEIKRQTGV